MLCIVGVENWFATFDILRNGYILFYIHDTKRKMTIYCSEWFKIDAQLRFLLKLDSTAETVDFLSVRIFLQSRQIRAEKEAPSLYFWWLDSRGKSTHRQP